jgi:hypothetical protein
VFFITISVVLLQRNQGRFVWREEDDIMLLRDVVARNPWQYASQNQQSATWQAVCDSLNSGMEEGRVLATKRNVRDHTGKLVNDHSAQINEYRLW